MLLGVTNIYKKSAS